MKHPFTDEEKLFIEENYLKMKYIKIAERLGREKQEINMYIFRAGLSKRNPKAKVIDGFFNVHEKENWI